MNICEFCHWVHSAGEVVRIGRFSTAPKFRAQFDGAPIRETRDEAMRDLCANRAGRNQETLPLTFSPVPKLVRAEKPVSEPVEFPAALMETAARAEAWKKFLEQVLFSLTVWNLDDTVRTECAHVADWLAVCRDDLNHMIQNGATA